MWLSGSAERTEQTELRVCVRAFSETFGWKINEEFDLTVKSMDSYNSSFELLVKDLQQYKKQGYRIALLSGSRTRAERLAKDLQEEGLSAFYREDSDRRLSPGEIMVVYGHARRVLVSADKNLR